MIKLPWIGTPLGWLKPSLPASIRGQIFASFGMLLLILAAFVSISVLLARQHQTDLAHMEDSTNTVAWLSDALAESRLANLLLERYVITGDERLIPIIRTSVTTVIEGVADARSQEEARGHESPPGDDDGAELTELDEITAGAALLQGTSEEVISLMRGGDVEGARANMEATVPDRMALGVQLSEATDLERLQLSLMRSQADRSAELAVWTLIAFGALASATGVAASILIARSMLKPLRRLAYHDPLTDLPNRSLLKDHLELAIAQARRSGHKVAVMFLDVDRFKVINDTLGHPSGDKLLKRIGKQLTRVVREGDTVARVGGDEFILLLPDLTDPDDARVVAERALQRIRRKRSLDGRELVVTASLGISVYPSDGDDAETLLSHADTAMYKAKDNGRSQYEFYDASMGAAVSEQLRLESDLRRALAHDEFVLHYQPQIAIDSGELVGIEALIRWQHPERGLLLPNEFIGVAQDSGLMTRLDERSLRAASAQCVAWQRAHSPSLRLSVNFATNALLDRGLPQRVESTLRSSGLAPASLVVEITEQHAVQDLPSTQRALRELKTLGVQIAVDDFGTGHSSLAYLSQFPIDVVKIDRAFVAGIGRTPEDSAIVVAIVSMARGLGLKVIAEGVETEEQLAFLKALRCDEFQGYLFSKPVPPDELEKLLSMSDRRRSG
ncbi:MAG: EAL domain-containing protein [Chloroflexi bacterium]|nr:EAL domain-containing protein [Chloroflexota bacterium]